MGLRCTRGQEQEYWDPDTGRRYWSWSELCRVLYGDQYATVDPDVLDAARDRGRVMHVLFARLLLHYTTRDRRGRERPEGLGPLPPRPEGDLAPYYDSLLAWCQARRPQALRIEEPAVVKGEPLAGRPDTLCWLGGRLTLVDLKTGDHHPSHATQLVVYSHLEGYEGAEDLVTLYAQRDGTIAQEVPAARSAQEWTWALQGLAVLKGRLARRTVWGRGTL